MTFVIDESVSNATIICGVCLDAWDEPVEIDPCGHIYCKGCLSRVARCPECRGDIRGRRNPHRVLMNLANEVRVRCTLCSWRGTREQSRVHTVCLQAAQPVQPAVNQSAPQQVWNTQPQRPPQPPANNWHACPWLEFGMTQEEYDHIMCVFMTFDTDGSGELSRRELTTLCRYLNYAQRPEQIDAMFAEMDSDRSGQLSMREFCTWVSMHRPDPSALYGLSPVAYQEIMFAFHSFDTNQDGTLSEHEFAQLAITQGWVRNAMEASQLFRSIDTDRSGAIDMHEMLMYRSRGLAPPPPPPPPQQQPPWQPQPAPYPPYQQQQQQPWPPANGAYAPQQGYGYPPPPGPAYPSYQGYQQAGAQGAPPGLGYPPQQQPSGNGYGAVNPYNDQRQPRDQHGTRSDGCLVM